MDGCALYINYTNIWWIVLCFSCHIRSTIFPCTVANMHVAHNSYSHSTTYMIRSIRLNSITCIFFILLPDQPFTTLKIRFTAVFPFERRKRKRVNLKCLNTRAFALFGVVWYGIDSFHHDLYWHDAVCTLIVWVILQISSAHTELSIEKKTKLKWNESNWLKLWKTTKKAGWIEWNSKRKKCNNKKLALIKYLHRYVYVCNESDYLEWQAAIVHIFDKICATEMRKVEKG